MFMAAVDVAIKNNLFLATSIKAGVVFGPRSFILSINATEGTRDLDASSKGKERLQSFH